MSILKSRPFARVGLLAIPLLVCIYLLGKYSTTYPQGVDNCSSQTIQNYQQPIIAFEFAQTPQDIQNVLGCFSDEFIHQIDFANQIDFGFMFFYSLFLFLFFRVAYQRFSSKWLRLAMLLPFITFFGDIIENLQLFDLTAMFTSNGASSDMNTSLFWLEISTWSKWLTLALALALCGRIYMNFNRVSKVIGAICFAPIALGIWAFIGHDVLAINNFVASVFTVFFLVIVWSWLVEGKVIST